MLSLLSPPSALSALPPSVPSRTRRLALLLAAALLAGGCGVAAQAQPAWPAAKPITLDRGMLLVHLGMSGSLRFASHLPEADKHDHWDLVTSSGTLRLHDPRRFGAVVYAVDEGDPVAVKLLGCLGMEPLGGAFAVDTFVQGVRSSRLPIKQLLLAGRLVVGVGNIYASEALFLAGIRPTVRSSGLTIARIKRLHQSICEVLERAVQMGGSSLKDFSSADGASGHFQTAAQVYGRAQAPCHVCATPIKMVRQGQRSSFYCPVCQR